ncbi:hypothetical protein CAPTEDRAFT_218199, partial [Capitella teleta]
MDQTENNKCSIQFWKEGTGVYTHRNYLVLTPGHIVTNTEDYDCKRDILHLASDAYLLHYLFPCRISVPYIYYILDGVQMRQMVWNYSKDGIDIPVIGVGRTMVKSFDGCGFMDFSRMEFRRSVPIPRLEADADGTMTTKQRSGVIRYPLRDKIRLTLSEFSEQGFASRCCSVYLYIHLELPNPQQMWNITIDGTSRHTTGNMYDGVHLVTVRNVFQWKMSWKSRTLRWKIPGNIVYDPRGLNSILNNMEIKLHSAQLQNDSIGSIMVRFKREVLPLYKGISGNGVGNMGSTELCSTPYGLSGIEYCFPDEEWAASGIGDESMSCRNQQVLHTKFLLFYHSIWKSSILLKFMDSFFEKALIRRVRERIWKMMDHRIQEWSLTSILQLSLPEEEAVEQ